MLIGHQKIWNFFVDSKSNLSHAYLFSGVEKIGKKRLAVEVVKLLNCKNLEDSLKYQKYPCLKCKNCLDIEKNQFPDLFILEKKEDKKEVEIEQVRDLKKNLSFKPYNSEFKIVIIDNTHLMNLSAQNALLKTLEEPLGQTIVFLISDKPKKLLETILSRVQEIRFFNPGKEEILDYLLSIEISDETKKEIKTLFLDQGNISPAGLVVDFVNNPKKIADYKDRVKELKTIIESPLHIKFDYIKKLISDSSDDKEILDDKRILEILILWSNFFQNLLLTDKINREKNRLILEKIDKIYFLISTTNVNKKLALETLVLEF